MSSNRLRVRPVSRPAVVDPTLSLPRRIRSRNHPRRRLWLESLERRELLATSESNLSAMVWTEAGPAPSLPSPSSADGGDDGLDTGLGPNAIGIFSPVAGRIDSIAPSPTDPNTIYVASAGGGVWKTTDGGTTWIPLTDTQATLSMGKLALAPSNPNIIYAGTGDSEANLDGGGNLDSRITPGRGVLKSTNGGISWTLLGSALFDRREIGGVVVDPTDPNTVYVSVANFVAGSLGGNTGVWKSTDGGATWTNTTNSATASIAPGDSFLGLVMDPTNNQVLYAAASNIGGNAGNGVYKTTDGGVHWAAAGDFPIGGTAGRIALAGSRTNNQVLYAGVADTSTGLVSFYQTRDAGAHWTLLPGIPQIINPANSQAFYDTNVAVDPTDATGNTFYASGQAGANSILRVVVTPGTPPTTAVVDISGGTNAPHADHHALAFDASNRLLDGNDGGIWRLDTVTPAVTWTDDNGNIGITQFIGIASDPTSASIVLGGSQDNGTEKFTGVPAWTAVRGGDGGYTQIDQSNHMIVYHEFFGISLERSIDGGTTWTGISPPGATGGLFYIPYVLDPNNSKRMVYGTATLYETTDATAAPPVWTAIGTPGTNGFNPGGNSISAVAISPSSPNTIYVTTESQVFVTTNDGASWTNASIPGVSTGLEGVTIDPFNSLIAYVVRDQYGGGKLFKTTDGGSTWADISGNLPNEPAHTLAIDPRTSPETLLLGNNIGVYASFNQGTTWVRYASGLPNVQVKQLQLELNGGVDVLNAGTYGRGVFQLLANTPLVVTALAPTGLEEGKPFGPVEVATFTDPTPGPHLAASYAATIDWGDGTPDTAGIVIEDASGVFHVSGSHTYGEEGAPITTVTVASTGGSSGGASATLAVADAPLSALGATVSGIEGLSLSSTAKPPGSTDVLVATFTDADPGGIVSDYSATIAWGDGTTSAATRITAAGGPNGVTYSVYGDHTYPEAGSYPLSVTVTDIGMAVTITAVTDADIADAQLSPSATQPNVSTTEAALFPVPQFGKPAFIGPVGSFTDANPTAPLSDFRAGIDWGDGTSMTLGTISQPGGVGTALIVSGSHTYADSGVNGGVGIYAIQVFVGDVDGSRLILTNTANVADNPIALAGTLNPASDSGLSTGTIDVTKVKQPDFYGSSEPFSHVTLLATALPGGIPFQIGQVQARSNGSWNIKSVATLADGHYEITATAVDQFGVTHTTAPTVITPDLNIDTHGPVITGVFFNRLNGQVDYTIQDPSPASGLPSGVWVNTLYDSSNYLFTKVHADKAYPGKWVVTNVAVAHDPVAANAYDVAVTFNGGAIIQGGYYLFTIRDSSNGKSSVQDRAENHLDGVFYGSFPSGNGINGSDFVAELESIHNKVFAPQTIIGTSNAQNGGNGGLPVAPIHSGIWVPVIPLGGSPIFSTTTSPTKPVAIVSVKKPTGSVVVKAKNNASVIAPKTSQTLQALLVQTNNHPKGPVPKK
jgi:photosystem II stability/assembly factor-like uncharacterized protein